MFRSQLEDDQGHGHHHARPLRPLRHRHVGLQLRVVLLPVVKRPDISRTHHRSLLYPDLVSRLGFREPLDPEVCQVDGDVGGYQLVSEVLQDANRLF